MISFVDNYEISRELLKSELEVFKEQNNNTKQYVSLFSMFWIVYPHRVCYTRLYTTFLIAAVLLKTTAENEKSFSCMKRVKIYLRIVMDDDRLGTLATLSMNRERSSRLNAEDIVDDFAKLANRIIALI